MNVVYVASAGTPHLDRLRFAENDISCFEKLEGLDAYTKEVYFYPRSSSTSTWPWVIGYEKATKDKSTNRMWTTCWGFQLCVGGKGYYNGIPITKGTCFVSWPYVKHNIVADKDDPFEFYWLIINGSETLEFVNSCGFNDSHVVFKVEDYENIAKLFEHGLNKNYAHVDVYSYVTALAKMILSFNKPEGDVGATDEKLLAEKNYSKMIRTLLKRSNYTLTIKDISKRMGLTSKHLSRVFYNESGEHLKQYIVRKKMDFAAKLLRSGATPTEVSLILKYSSYSAFHTMFVSRFGMSPINYSKMSEK